MEEKKIVYPCVYAICAGMPCGPIIIPEEHRVSEKVVVNYVLELMKSYIRGRAIIRWDEKGIKNPTLFWRDNNGKPYYEK